MLLYGSSRKKLKMETDHINFYYLDHCLDKKNIKDLGPYSTIRF